MNDIHQHGAPDLSEATGDQGYHQVLQRRIPAADVVVEPLIYTPQLIYQLTEADYERIKGGRPFAVGAFFNVFMTAVGSVLLLATQAISNLTSDHPVNLDRLQVAVVAVTFFVSGIAWLIARFWPGDYSRTMKRIKSHFASSQSGNRSGTGQ